MNFTLIYSREAKKQLELLYQDTSQAKRFKAVTKALALMSVNIKHPSLNTHEYTKLSQMLGVKVFEAYAENNTPGAYRIFWKYSNNRGVIEIISITKHP